jgi:WNK lysine deficient protein kinase
MLIFDHQISMSYLNPDLSDKDVEPFVEVSPRGRYSRYGDLLGAGAVKKV